METQILNPNTDASAIPLAAKLLQNGGLVVIPTETVYGLAANALDPEAVRNIYIAKGRPGDNPLIVHISSFEEIYPLVKEVPEAAKRLAEKFWPGPLTVILPKSDLVPSVTSGGLDTVAIRMPSHPVAREVIRAAGVPLAAPSANISGFPSPTKVEYAADDMTGRVPLILDGGECAVGVESTVLTLAAGKPRILRPGGITPEMLREVLGEVEVDRAVLDPLGKNETAASPGMKYKHYSPETRVRIYRGSEKGYLRYFERHPAQGQFALCFEETAPLLRVPFVTFGRKDDCLTQTHRLFDALRELDEAGASLALAQCPPPRDVGLAVCNRLFRVAGFDFIDEAPIVGLTGQTGAGKSTVANVFASAGYRVVDTDKLAREIVETGSPVLRRLAEAFGEDILDGNGALIRARLAERAFADAEKTALLNSITHPEILRRTAEAAFSFSERNIPCLLDVPLLFQSGADAICDVTVAVTAPAETRKRRIMERDGISEEAAALRMGAQEPEAYYTARADIIIRNPDGADPGKAALAAAERIKTRYGGIA
ncbi:MAG: threonylcarbamoyl-AMP synthase [Clostridia bacterium]|nr:threonylcarbamoyl-AMP synthase [Clostridia bacterium]